MYLFHGSLKVYLVSSPNLDLGESTLYGRVNVFIEKIEV